MLSTVIGQFNAGWPVPLLLLTKSHAKGTYTVYVKLFVHVYIQFLILQFKANYNYLILSLVLLCGIRGTVPFYRILILEV